jgi:putative membrane protein
VNRKRFQLFLKGMAMGAADSVPGVSGGTVALITNIYEELVDAIKSLGWHVLLVWKREGFMAAWRYCKGDFLLTLLTGILCSLLILGRLILGLMENYLPFLLAFFAGLVLASLYFVSKNISRWNLPAILLFLSGMSLALLPSILPIATSNNSLMYYFISGAIAICAMILPGISGAFILILLGVYGSVLEALTGFNWPVIIVFASGCLCGLMLFSRLLSWLLLQHHDLTLSVLTGMLAGSLYLLWPWRVARDISLEAHAFTSYQHTWPGTYTELTGVAFSPIVGLLLIACGVGIVLLLDYVAGNKHGSEPG